MPPVDDVVHAAVKAINKAVDWFPALVAMHPFNVYGATSGRTRARSWRVKGHGTRVGREAHAHRRFLGFLMVLVVISTMGTFAFLRISSSDGVNTAKVPYARGGSIHRKHSPTMSTGNSARHASTSHDIQQRQRIEPQKRSQPLHRDEGQFYIYQGDIIDFLTTGVLRCMPQFPDHQDSAEYWIHKALSVHPKRTLDPEKAQLFYVPTYNCLSSMLWKHTPCNGTRHLERMKALGQFIRNSTFYRRNGGTDHFLVCQSHYCPFRMLRREPGRLLAPGFLLMHEKNPVWSFGWCPYRIINIPYVSQQFEGVGSWEEQRRWLVSFHGAMNRDWKVTWDDVVLNRTGIVVPTGSDLRSRLHVIQHLERVDIGILQGGAGFNFDEMEAVKREAFRERYRTAMLSSTFCFHIKGDTPTSRRFFDAVAAGCIPVVISDGMKQNLAFPWRVQYDDAAVHVAEDEWLASPELVVERLRILETNTDSIQRMRRMLSAARVHFDYRNFGAEQVIDQGGVLVDNILQEMVHRKKRCTPGVCCREWVDETDPVLQSLPSNFPRVG